MDRNRHIRLADEHLRKLVNLYNNLYSSTGEASQIDLDLILEELRKLYSAFKTISLIPVEDFPELVNCPRPETYYAQQSPSDAGKQTEKASNVLLESTSQKSEDIEQPQTKETTPLNFKETSDFEIPPKTEYKHLSASNTPALFTEDNSQSAIWNDRFSNHTTQPHLAEKLFATNVGDIRDAININDKFSFVNKLFANDISAYQEALEKINNAENFNLANRIFLTYYNAAWDENREVCMRFVDFMKRRFSV